MNDSSVMLGSRFVVLFFVYFLVWVESNAAAAVDDFIHVDTAAADEAEGRRVAE